MDFGYKITIFDELDCCIDISFVGEGTGGLRLSGSPQYWGLF